MMMPHRVPETAFAWLCAWVAKNGRIPGDGEIDQALKAATSFTQKAEKHMTALEEKERQAAAAAERAAAEKAAAAQIERDKAETIRLKALREKIDRDGRAEGSPAETAGISQEKVLGLGLAKRAR